MTVCPQFVGNDKPKQSIGQVHNTHWTGKGHNVRPNIRLQNNWKCFRLVPELVQPSNVQTFQKCGDLSGGSIRINKSCNCNRSHCSQIHYTWGLQCLVFRKSHYSQFSLHKVMHTDGNDQCAVRNFLSFDANYSSCMTSLWLSFPKLSTTRMTPTFNQYAWERRRTITSEAKW